MSLPFYTITCSGCNYVGGYNYGTHYIYHGVPGHEPALKAAWCNDCEEIVKICTPFTTKN